MATALFQCLDEAIAGNLWRTFPVAPCEIKEFSSFGKLACVVFDGNCGDMYWWCMDLTSKVPGRVAFIGIDETATSADDPYKITILSDMPMIEHTDSQKYYYNELVDQFLIAITRFELNDEQVKQICDASVIGVDLSNSAGHCKAVMRLCLSDCASQNSCRSWLMIDDESFYSSQGGNTMVRVMAHICYLDKALSSKNEAVNESPAHRFLRFIFGRPG